jgi:exodeoxyribonuclease V gamma subunit
VDDENEPVELYSSPGEGTLLKLVQWGILYMEDEIPSGSEREVLAGDGSLIINSCHSPMRESEVLYDYLLHRFNRESGLKPRDILIVTPDIENYAPFIHAVFSTPENEEKKIPVAVNDTKSSTGSGVADIFFSILELEKSRYSAGSVLDLLDSWQVSGRFGFSVSCIEKIHSWIERSNIRWGPGGGFREEIGLPPVEENSWLHGIRRLLLGYAMTGGDGDLPGGILPLDLLEGEDARLFGRFNSFIESVMKTAEIIKVPHPLKEWSRHLGNILESFIDISSEDDPQTKSLNRGISLLASYQEASGFNEEIDLRIVSEYLRSFVNAESPPGRYVSGAVTLASTLPVRTIPFKIICMIGMNHDVFPRSDYESPFDLIKKNPQRGDRSLRDEDRYIFLETILSAREGLYISYTGQNIQDNSEIPPSIVVSELIDFLTDLLPGKRGPAGSFFFRHPLHSFSSRYFTGEGPFISYSEENFNALQSRKSENKKNSFITRPLDPDEQPEEIDIRDLVYFFLHPVRFLLENIIGMDYRRERTFIPDNSEPFVIGGLEKYSLETEILDCFLTGQDCRKILERVKKEGVLPHGTPGDIQFGRMVPGIARFSDKVKEQMKGNPLEPVEISFEIEGTLIRGMLETVRSDTILHYNYRKSRGRDFFRPWIEHLAAACAGHEQLPRRSILVQKNRTWKLGAVDNPEDILKDLVSLYRKGTREPLLFFPDTSYGYAEKIYSGKPDEQAFKLVMQSMIGSGSNRGDKGRKGDLDDPYNSRCFSIENININEFKDLSLRIFRPLLEAAERV